MKIKITTAIIGAIVIAVILILIFQAGGHLPFLNHLLDNLNPFKPQQTITTVSIVIEDIQQVSQLVTTKYTIQMVKQKGDAAGWAWWHLIMVEKGTVDAGLDLTQLTSSNVNISEDGKTITVTLPPVKILTETDNILSSNSEDTYIYDKASWGWIDLPNFNDVETQMRGEAGALILASACNDGILTDATNDAKTAVEKFLTIANPNVTVQVKSGTVPSVNECMGQ